MEVVKGRGRGLKRFVLVVLFLLGALGVLVFTYSFWLPYAARPIAKRYGVTFQGYERLKDGRFALTGITRTNQLFDLKIARLEGFLPHVWRTKVKDTNFTGNFLEMNGWKVVLHERAKKERARNPARTNRLGAYDQWKRAERSIAQARYWVPRATLLNGSIERANKEYTFSVITWERGVLDGTGVYPVSAVPIDIKGKLTGDPPYQLSVAMNPLDLRARLRLVETNGLLNAQLTGFYKENKVDLVANFAREGTLPLTATLKAPNFKVPGELLKLDKYSEITGSLSGDWKTNFYTLQLKAHAQPIASATLPPGDVDLALRGDTNSVRVEKAVSTIPGLQLVVSDPIELSYRGTMLSERAEIQVDADLEKLPKLKLNGRVQGKILLEKGAPFPNATFRVGGTNVTGFKVEAESFQVSGKLAWPKLDELRARVGFGSNSLAEINGSADLRNRSLGETTVRAEGPLLTNLLPAGVSFNNVRLAATLSGNATNLQHVGEFELRDFVAPQLQPLTVEASWKAQQLTFDNLAMRARAGPATIFVSGSGFAGGGRTNFVVREMKFFKGDEVYLSLTEPSRIELATNNTGMEVEIRPMTFVGTNRQAFLRGGVAWPNAAAIEFRATNVNPSLFQTFMTRSLSGVDLEAFNLAAAWSNGPITGAISGRFSGDVEQFERLTAAIDLNLETNGIAIRQLSVLNPQAEICRAEGFVPVSVHPLDPKKVRVSAAEQINFQAETEPNEAFWRTVSKLSKLTVSNAALRLQVRGTTREPTGELQVKATGLALMRTNKNLPAIGPFEGRLVLSEAQLSVPAFSVRVEDQPVSVSGKLPLGENFWTQRREEVLPYVLDHAELHVEAPDVNLAPFAEHLPKYLRAQGKLFANVWMRPGRNFDGRVEVRDVETRPLPKVGVVQQISGDVVLKGKELRIENMSGALGGETLSVGGRVNLSAESVAKGYPDLEFSIAGYNLPLARNPDVILRSDLNLKVTNGTNRIPVISGTANLRDSFLLRDIATLVPGRVARPEMRPPYFTLPQDPVDEWTLDIRVRGERFMRVRSPFFQGVVSANFHVSGNLEEPVALGDASISSGRIIFPFASLEVKQALVSLTSEDPYLPHIFAMAAGRAFGFDIRMQVEGPADEPVIQFSSVPSLTSEQIVLMLTTGQIPRQDFGFSTEDRASKLAFFLGKSLLSKLNPNQSAEERLTIRSGQDVTEKGRQTYEVEYKLNDRWSLVGEYNRFGDLNGNVKWRVFSR
jgi:translocation and assembly module TamB